MGASKEKTAPMKMVPRRPTQLLMGSESHPALRGQRSERITGERTGHDSQQGNSDIRARIDKSNEPRVALTVPGGSARGPTVRYAKIGREVKVGSIGAGLVPALYGGSNGVEDDGKVKSLRVSPPVGQLIAQGLAILLIKLDDAVDAFGMLGDQCTLLEQREDVGQVGLGGEGLDVLEELMLGDANEGIFDSTVY